MHKKNIKKSTDRLEAIEKRIDEIATCINDMTDKCDSESKTLEDEVEKTIEFKLQIAFSEAVGSQ